MLLSHLSVATHLSSHLWTNELRIRGVKRRVPHRKTTERAFLGCKCSAASISRTDLLTRVWKGHPHSPTHTLTFQEESGARVIYESQQLCQKGPWTASRLRVVKADEEASEQGPEARKHKWPRVGVPIEGQLFIYKHGDIKSLSVCLCCFWGKQTSYPTFTGTQEPQGERCKVKIKSPETLSWWHPQEPLMQAQLCSGDQEIRLTPEHITPRWKVKTLMNESS